MVSKKLALIVFVVFLLIGLFFALKNQILVSEIVDDFFTKHEEIKVKSLFIGGIDDPGGEKTFSSPISGDYYEVMVTNGRRTEINFIFRKPISFDSFSLFFKGNLHSVSSYLAEDFDVYYQDESGGWQKIDEVRSNRSSVYQFYSPVTLSSDSIKILVSKAPFFNTVTVGDLKFYRRHKVGLIEGVRNFLFQQRKSLPAYIFYSFLFYILLLIPGYVILDLVKKRWNDSIEDKIVFAPIISIIILFFIASFYLLVGSLSMLNFYWIIFILCSFIFLKRRLDKEIFSAKFVLFLIGTVLLIIFLIQAQRDYLFNLQYIEKYLDQLEFISPEVGYYGYHADNTLQWRIAKLFLHKIPIFGSQTEDYLMGFGSPKVILDRTPLLPMITMVILRMFGESHFIYQRFLNVLATFYYGGVYLLLKNYSSKKVARISSILLLLNIPLTFLAINAEVYYKYFAIFPITLAFALFLKEKKENSLLIGSLFGIGFLIHPMILIFSIALVLLYFLRYRLTFEFFKKTATAFSILICLLFIWSLIGQHLKSQAGITASNIYWEKMMTINKETMMNKLANFANIFVTNVLLKNPYGGRIRLISSDFWIPTIRFSIITNLTPLMFGFLLVYLIKNIKKNYEILLMAVIPFLVYIILSPDYILSWHYNMIYPFSIPCLLGYITSELVKENKRTRLILFGSYLVFMFISLYYVSGVFVEMKYTSLVIHGLFWGIILMYTFLSLLLIKIIARK